MALSNLGLEKVRLAKAHKYALRLINFRPRSEQEIRDRLRLKKFSPLTIAGTISYLKDLGLINDREFAGLWIDSRLRRPLGYKAIIAELQQKGINQETIKELIEEKEKSVKETRVIRELLNKRLAKARGKNESVQKTKSKLYSYLIRRGFSSEEVSEALNNLNDNLTDRQNEGQTQE